MWPHERSLVKKLAGKPFAVIGVNLNAKSTSALKKIVEKENLTWRSLSDPRTGQGWGPIAKQWNLAGTPTIYLIDPRGVIRNKWLMGARAEVIDHAVEELVGKAEAGVKERH